jgi:homoserine O-acetyltransferase
VEAICHQGISFVERFDANSYLYLTRHGLFDLAADCDGTSPMPSRARRRFCVVSFTSDWLFPTPGRAPSCMLNAGGARVSFAEIVTDKGAMPQRARAVFHR